MLAAALLASGCTRQLDPPAPPHPTITIPAPAPTAAVPTATGPMTAAELVWLEAVSTLHTKADKALADVPSHLTPAVLRSLAEQLRGCTRELAQLGTPSNRLQPVHDLARQGCGKYDQAAECFDTAARIGIPVAGTAEERKFDKALDCGFAAPGEGSRLLAESEIKADQIRQTARQ